MGERLMDTFDVQCPACSVDQTCTAVIGTRAVTITCEACGQSLPVKLDWTTDDLPGEYVDAATDAYLDTAWWADVPDAYLIEEGPADWAADTLDDARHDVAGFLLGSWQDVHDLDPTAVGGDFWLTRNRHGAGFWDRGLGARGDRLTDDAHAYGEASVYVDDAGTAHVI
jgi:hypothetical protein